MSQESPWWRIIPSNGPVNGAVSGPINGAINAPLSMRPGERQLWHIARFRSNRLFRLGVTGHPIITVGCGGVLAFHPTSTDRLLCTQFTL